MENFASTAAFRRKKVMTSTNYASDSLSLRSRKGREIAKGVIEKAVDKDQMILVCAELLQNCILHNEQIDRPHVLSLVASVMKCADENSKLITSIFQ